MKKKIINITPMLVNFPISNNIYVEGLLRFKLLPKVQQKQIEKFMNLLMNLADEEWPADFVRFDINGKPLAFDDLLNYDLKDAIARIENGTLVASSKSSKKESLKDKNASSIFGFISFLKSYAEKTIETPSFYYHTIKVTEDLLFETVSSPEGETYKRIKRELLPFVRFLDLQDISFDGVSIMGDDLSHTNIRNLNINKVYKRSARGSNLFGIPFASEPITNADLENACIFENYGTIDASTTNINGIMIDDTTLILTPFGTPMHFSKPAIKTAKTPTLHF